MKSLTGKFSSVRGWAVLLILLLGAGLFVTACGDEEVPSPTTPAPTPPAPTPPAPEPEPEPEPAPEPPAVPVGLRISASGVDSITWTWNAVEGATGYVVQSNLDEMWDDTDTVMFGLLPFTTETTYTRTGLEAGTTVYARVAAAAGTAEAPLVSAFSTHVTGMTAEPEPEAPPAPANLRLKERGSDFIEWEWDEAPGADGYESQFSADGISFVALQPHAGASNTNRRVSNLAAETAGHLQVRSYTGSGTGADTVRGDWSASDRQATDEPPPAVALDAPDDFESSDPEEDSIVLTWDEVDDADYYEVEQSDDGGSSWDDAECGDSGSNEVDGTTCIASGLDAGTDYEFRVRGIPADDDDAHTTGVWSETDGTTEGTQPTTPGTTPGGAGMGNVRWHNGGDDNARLTFVWDREGDAMYETYKLDPDDQDDPADIHDDNPCENVADVDSADTPKYESRGSATSLDVTTIAPGTVRGLCVREEGSSEASFAWGISPPEEPNNGTPEIDKLRTTALEWTDVDLVMAFDYEVRLAADPERPAGDNKIGGTSKATSRAVQSACDAGSMVDSFTPDIDLENRIVSVDSGLNPHTGYLLCIRASNTAGTGAWAVPITADSDTAYGNNASVADEVFTRPAQSPAIASAGSESTAASGSNNEMLAPAWEIGTRNANNVPRNAADFVMTVFAQNADAPDADALRVADCGTTPEGYDAIDNNALTKRDGLSGFEIEVPSGSAIERVGFTRRVYLCAQANSGDGSKAGTGVGPWRISSAFSVSKPSTSLSTKSDSVTHNEAIVTIKGWNRQWWYKTNVENANCESVSAGTAEETLSLAASTSYTVRAWDDRNCEMDGRSLGSTSFRTKATP